MRMIDSDIWRDEWFIEQHMIGQLLWIGLITKIADDQGRFLYNAPLIKADLFPTNNDITNLDIDTLLICFVTDGKLYKYQDGNKTILQITNWWKHQGSSSFMSASKLPAPDGWLDCWRYHGKGNTLNVSSNWSNRNAGFVSLDSPLGSELRSNEDEDDVKDNDEVKDDGDIVTKKLTDCKLSYNANSATIIQGWKDDFPNRDDIIVRAIDEAIARGKNSLPYIDKILVNWKANGVPPTREEQIAAAKSEHKRPQSQPVHPAARLI